MSEERVVISEKLNDFVIFADEAIQYGMTRIPYAEVTATKFQSVSKTVNFIPNWDTYVFGVSSAVGEIQFRMTSWFRIGNRRKNGTFENLLRLTNKHIHPQIVKRMLTQLFVEGQTITVGPLRMNRLGMESSHRGYLPWSQLPSHRVYNGTLIIDAENPKDANKSLIFAAVNIGVPNALVLPILFQNIHKVIAAMA